jgi:hypothetical protein
MVWWKQSEVPVFALENLQQRSAAESNPVVFAGPSAEGLRRRYAGRCEFRPPIRRGELEALADGAPRTAVLLDGLFASSLAVTPTECRVALNRGWTLVGAASIGALRASELWSVGMIGVGTVYQMLRLGVIESDAEVAVAYHPETYRELTASLVHVRALLAAVYPGPAEHGRRESALAVAREIYWAERSWSALRAAWQRAGTDSALLRAALLESEAPRHHPKPADAALALRCVLDGGFGPRQEEELT